MAETIHISQFVYLILGIIGITVGPLGFAGFWRIENNPKAAILFVPVIIGGIISLLLFASTFGELAW